MPFATWKDRPIFVLDTETTGIDPATARVWEIARLRVRTGEQPSEARAVVNPAIEIPAEVVKLCSLAVEDLAHVAVAQPFGYFAPSLAGSLDGEIVAGYNLLDYDWPLLIAEFGRCDQQPPRPLALLDVLVMVRRLRSLRFRTLSEAFTALCRGQDVGSAHRAAADCRMTWAVFQTFLPELPADLDGLLHLQARWKAERDADFERYGYWLSTDPKFGRLVMACGKYCGQRLNQVDPSYLGWALAKSPTWDTPLPPATAEAFRAALSGKAAHCRPRRFHAPLREEVPTHGE